MNPASRSIPETKPAAAVAAGIVALLDARGVREAQTRGTPVLRVNDPGCRAPEDGGTIAALALWNGPGM